MRLASRARILGITSTMDTRSEEDGVENRSEPQGWLADGSPGSADPAQDADQAAGVKTALSTPDTQAADVTADDGVDEAEQAASPSSGSPAYANGGSANGNGSSPWDNGGSSYESSPGFESSSPFEASPGFESSSPFESGSSYESTSSWDNVSSASPSGSTVPASWATPAAEAAPPATDASVAAGFSGSPASGSNGSGSPTVAAYASPSYAAPPAPAPYQAPPKGRPKPPRPAKAGRPQGAPKGSRPGPGGSPAAGSSASTRKAQLTVSRIEPWSVMKFSFMISLVGWVILFVAVAIMYFVLSKLGVFHSIENTVGLVTASKDHAGSDASSWFSASRVLGYTMLVGAVNVILITALATVGAVLYNLVTMLAGGIEVTLKETD
jgi:Transmembrane domain of unknown function (DUF3566)